MRIAAKILINQGNLRPTEQAKGFSMNNVWKMAGMARVGLGLLLFLADVLYMKPYWQMWSFLPLTSLMWAGFFGIALFMRQGKLSDFVWVLTGISVIVIISGGLMLEPIVVKILVIQVVFGFFAGTVMGAGFLEYRTQRASLYSTWFNSGSVVTGLGCLVLMLLVVMNYFFEGKFGSFFQSHAAGLTSHDNVLVASGIVTSVLFSAAIGFLFSYGLKSSLFAMLFLLSGVVIVLSFQGLSWDMLFASLGILLGFAFGSSIGSGVKKIAEISRSADKT